MNRKTIGHDRLVFRPDPGFKKTLKEISKRQLAKQSRRPPSQGGQSFRDFLQKRVR